MDRCIVEALGECWHEMVRDSDSHYITCSCGEVSTGIRAFFLHAQENNRRWQGAVVEGDVDEEADS